MTEFNKRGNRHWFGAASLSFMLLQGLFTVSPAHAELRVVATVKPIHSLIASVMGTAGKPHLIVKGAASPHSYALKPSDAAALQRADIIFRVGETFETFLNAAIEGTRSGSGGSATVINLSGANGIKNLPFRTGADWAATDDHGHGAKESSHHHHREAIDPHIWLSPTNAIAIVEVARTTLAGKSPEKASIFKLNADSTIARIRELEAEIRAQLRPARDRKYLVYHDAYQYFESAFDVPAQGAIALGDSRAPGAKRIRDLRARIKKDGIICVFTEPQFEPKLARTLTAGTSARIGALDPIGAGIEPGTNAYFELMRANAKALADCLRSP